MLSYKFANIIESVISKSLKRFDCGFLSNHIIDIFFWRDSSQWRSAPITTGMSTILLKALVPLELY